MGIPFKNASSVLVFDAKCKTSCTYKNLSVICRSLKNYVCAECTNCVIALLLKFWRKFSAHHVSNCLGENPTVDKHQDFLGAK
jgi:hypothetical protein